MLSNCGCVEITSLTFVTGVSSVSSASRAPLVTGWDGGSVCPPFRDTWSVNCRSRWVRLASPPSDDRERAMMFVDAALLRSGANETQQASGHAHQAAEHLSGRYCCRRCSVTSPPPSRSRRRRGRSRSITRDFCCGTERYLAMSAVALYAAAQFTDMEVNNAASLRAVRCNSDT